MDSIEVGSMRKFINNIYTILRTDEVLMRLLNYHPFNYREGIPNPLDIALPDIVDDSDRYWDLVERSVVTGSKTSDIQEDGICRLYIYAGRRRPKFGNYLIASQEIVVDVFVHELFNRDDRMSWINDRINHLLVLEHGIAGLGKLEYAAGNSRVAPIGYNKYEHTFTFNESKK